MKSRSIEADLIKLDDAVDYSNGVLKSLNMSDKQDANISTVIIRNIRDLIYTKAQIRNDNNSK